MNYGKLFLFSPYIIIITVLAWIGQQANALLNYYILVIKLSLRDKVSVIAAETNNADLMRLLAFLYLF